MVQNCSQEAFFQKQVLARSTLNADRRVLDQPYPKIGVDQTEETLIRLLARPNTLKVRISTRQWAKLLTRRCRFFAKHWRDQTDHMSDHITSSRPLVRPNTIFVSQLERPSFAILVLKNIKSKIMASFRKKLLR